MILEDFSAGYYKLEMFIEPYENGPVITHDLYDYIQTELYNQTDVAPLCTLSFDGSPHFDITSEAGMPLSTMGIPESWFSDLDINRNHEKESVFIVKPKYAYQFNTNDIKQLPAVYDE